MAEDAAKVEDTPKGPIQRYVDLMWAAANQAFDDGVVHEAIVAAIESNLAEFETTIERTSPPAVEDLDAAKHAHTFAKYNLNAKVAHYDVMRAQMTWAANNVVTQMNAFNQHAVRSLTLANGGMVVAMLAFIANNHAKIDTTGPVLVIALCSIGFFLSLLGSYLVARLSEPILQPLGELSAPHIAAATVTKKFSQIRSTTRRMMWVTHPIFWLSAAMLIAAGAIGVCALIS